MKHIEKWKKLLLYLWTKDKIDTLSSSVNVIIKTGLTTSHMCEEFILYSYM